MRRMIVFKTGMQALVSITAIALAITGQLREGRRDLFRDAIGLASLSHKFLGR